ncbi:hypothetical protein FLCU109888_11595 [Flavobacterium cucumis]|uniref:Uncharacterized protein n=1 Tax=Flavobacterium cucumis TaxID=416016 RepID=A0A1M7ZVI1_9FLAO|nr:hypothetical protein [Flavobacterium cucumis]SHO72894.1 hypothetical protein SAMN05443547_1239 [Flavobacterium cucumis]
MSNVSKKVLAFKVERLNPEAKSKIDAMMKRKADELEKVANDFKEGKLTFQM